jgi:hypothetical protein
VDVVGGPVMLVVVVVLPSEPIMGRVEDVVVTVVVVMIVVDDVGVVEVVVGYEAAKRVSSWNRTLPEEVPPT